MKNILDIIYGYSINNKLLDKKAINKIVELIIKEFNIEIIDEINIITNFNSSLSNVNLATYSEGEIEIFLSRI